MSEADRIVEFLYEVGQLKRLPRAGWLFTGVQNPESVAAHSFRVGVLAYAIAVQEGANPDRAATTTPCRPPRGFPPASRASPSR